MSEANEKCLEWVRGMQQLGFQNSVYLNFYDFMVYCNENYVIK